MSKKEKDRFEICEMFMAKADRYRCFFGIIKRFEDQRGNPNVFSKIVMPDNGFIVAQSSHQKELGKNLDEMCVMILDMGLHNKIAIKIELSGEEFYLN